MVLYDVRYQSSPHKQYPRGNGEGRNFHSTTDSFWNKPDHPRRVVFPNPVVEKALGVPATTRWWETLERAAELLGQ